MFSKSVQTQLKGKRYSWTLAFLLAVVLLCGLTQTAFAETEGTGASSDENLSVGEKDVGVTTPLVSPGGEAEIVEHTTEGSSTNQKENLKGDHNAEDLTFDNDIPSVTKTEI